MRAGQGTTCQNMRPRHRMRCNDALHSIYHPS